MPEVSVVTTVYNGEDFLRQAIDSVLRQTFEDWELIVVNDGSTDASAGIVKSYTDRRIRLIDQENTGLGVAANNGIRKAQGKWIARLDDDDVWEPKKLQMQVEFLKTNPKHVLVGSNAMAVNHRGDELYPINMPTEDDQIREVILEHNPFIHSSVVFKKEAFDEIDGYYEPMNKYMVDYLLMYQLSKAGKVANLPQKLVRYRISTSSIGHSFGSENPEVTRLIQKGVKEEGLSAKDRERLRELKNQQFISERERKSRYHFFSGRALLFYRLQRKAAIGDFLSSLRYEVFSTKTWGYLGIAIFAPKPLINLLHRKLLSSHVKDDEGK